MRHETCDFKIEVDKSQYEKHKQSLDQLSGGKLDYSLIDGDVIRVNYKFHIDYFGNIVERFDAILDILRDPADIVKVDLVKIGQGEILIVKIIDRLRQVQQAIRDRQ